MHGCGMNERPEKLTSKTFNKASNEKLQNHKIIKNMQSIWDLLHLKKADY